MSRGPRLCGAARGARRGHRRNRGAGMRQQGPKPLVATLRSPLRAHVMVAAITGMSLGTRTSHGKQPTTLLRMPGYLDLVVDATGVGLHAVDAPSTARERAPCCC